VIRAAPRPRADVAETCADIKAIATLTGFAPATPLAVGVPRFADWFRDWHAALQTRG
jgi:UDP-glucuronate 4-epimerase